MKNWQTAKKWRDIIEAYFNQQVSAFFLTHHHGDHCFGNQVFNDVPIISQEATREIMIEWAELYWTSENLVHYKPDGYGVDGLKITYPTICFDKNLIIHGENASLEIICLNGHTKGSSILWETQSKTLIAGDIVFNHQYPYGGDPTTELPVWIDALSKIINYDPKTTISGHGPPATIEDLTEIKDFLSSTYKYILNEIESGLTPEEIAKNSDYPDYYGKDRIERRQFSLENWAKIIKETNG
jgi:cyclase